MKKVLLIIVDALASRIVNPAIADGRLPTFARLAEAGVLRKECTSIFPSITPAATASLVTGRYPAQHGIAGAFWYERDENRVAYYGDDFWVAMNEGIGEYFNDFLVKLNYERLQAKTLFELVERGGRSAAVLDFMWFKGDVEHEVNAPLLLKLMPGATFTEHIRGPQITAIGDFVTSPIGEAGKLLTAKGGMFRRFGFHDETTAEYLLELAEASALPDFTLAYFPNNDYESHSEGPQKALSTVERVDEVLAKFIDLYGGLDVCLDNMTIVITGDHSQSDMADDESVRSIDLSDVLEEFQLVSAGKEWNDGDDLMVCPNLRAAQIYFHQPPTDHQREKVVAQILTEPRVDQVMWSESFDDDRPCRFHIRTHDRGRLEFHLASHGSSYGCVDHYGNQWNIDGDLSVIDARITSGKKIEYGDYPNALERVANGFCEDCGDLWLTARVGSEFCVPETSVHPGGSHGTLHALDSTAPLIVAGLPDHVTVPERPRSIDVAPLCLQVLDIRS